MPDSLKHIIFFTTAPIMMILLFIVYFLYGDDSDGTGWYQDLWDGNLLEWTLAVFLAPIFFSINKFVNFFYPIWEEWSE